MLQNWKDIKIEEISKIERVADIFQVWSITLFPYGQVKFYIYEMQDGRYLGKADMAAKKKGTDFPDWIEGNGNSIVEALENAIRALLQSIEKHEATSEQDFVWNTSGH